MQTVKPKGLHKNMENTAPRHLSGKQVQPISLLLGDHREGFFYGIVCTLSFLDNQDKGQLLGGWRERPGKMSDRSEFWVGTFRQ